MEKITKVKELFPGYLEWMVLKGMDPKTIREHKRFLDGPIVDALGDRDIESLRIVDAARVQKAGGDYGEYGPQRAIVTFRRLLKYAKGSGFSMPFDYRDLEVPKVKKKLNEAFLPEEMDEIRDALDVTELAGLRTRTLIEVLLDTGMRITEACMLKKLDIDWERHEARIINAKTKDEEKVFFTDRSLEWMKRYWDARKDDLPWAFVSGRGHLLPTTSRNYIRTHLDSKLPGVRKHIKHHNFRKTFTTTLIEGGADITAVADLARHKSPRTTLQYYAAVNKKRSKDVHQRVLNKMLNGRVLAEEYFDEQQSAEEREKAKKRII